MARIYDNLSVEAGAENTVRLGFNTPGAGGAVFTHREINGLIDHLRQHVKPDEEDDELAKMQGYQTRRKKSEDGDGRDDYPTPPWATRAFLHHVLPEDLTAKAVWEPAANRGYMVRPLQERFGTVIATDLHDYGVGYPVVDFLNGPTPKDYGQPVDWIITNPPFNKAEEFLARALSIATEGVAIFARASFLEGQGRYERVFKENCPEQFCPYVERVPIVEGGVDPKATSQMPYAWFVWRQGKDHFQRTRVAWIPPSRKDMDREDDYS